MDDNMKKMGDWWEIRYITPIENCFTQLYKYVNTNVLYMRKTMKQTLFALTLCLSWQWAMAAGTSGGVDSVGFAHFLSHFVPLQSDSITAQDFYFDKAETNNCHDSYDAQEGRYYPFDIPFRDVDNETAPHFNYGYYIDCGTFYLLQFSLQCSEPRLFTPVGFWTTHVIATYSKDGSLIDYHKVARYDSFCGAWMRGTRQPYRLEVLSWRMPTLPQSEEDPTALLRHKTIAVQSDGKISVTYDGDGFFSRMIPANMPINNIVARYANECWMEYKRLKEEKK